MITTANNTNIAAAATTTARCRFGWCEIVSAALLLIAGVAVPATLVEAE
jgi:hypothetical protein